MFKPTSVLVPTDFSAYSEAAFSEALDIAEQYKARVYLVHVIHEEIHRCMGDYCFSDAEIATMDQKLADGAREALQRQLAKFPRARNMDVVTEVRKGFPAEQILKAQEERAADLIVISPFGRTGLAQSSLGGVTNHLVKAAKSPVLVVR